MDVQEILSQARDAMTVKRVFGEPYARNGLTIIPVARVMGGGGGGEGPQVAPGETVPAGPEGSPELEARSALGGPGFGGGFGMAASPAGVYVIKDDDVRWVPAVDLNRILVGAQVVAIVFLLVVRSMARARSVSRGG